MAGQVWATNSLGGFLYSLTLSDVLRTAVQPLVKFRQLTDAKDFTNHGKRRGQTFTWDVINDVATQGTVLTETNTIPSTNFTITQGTGTIVELGNEVPYTGVLDDFSKFEVQAIVEKTLKNDCKKALDQQAYNQFNATLLLANPSGSGTSSTAVTIYTNGTVTGTTNQALNNSHVKSLVDQMKERNIPPYVGDDYVAVAHPTTWRTLKNNLETIHQYTDKGLSMILNGEIGRYESTRFVEQTNIAKAGWTNTNQAFFMGEDTVAEGIAVPEEVRGKIPSDYGRSKGVAWYYLGGFALVHTVAAQSRIVKWASEA